MTRNALAWVALISAFALPVTARADEDDLFSAGASRRVAPDTEPPRVQLMLPRQAPPGRLVLRARITDASGVVLPTIYWRHEGESRWVPAELSVTQDDLYAATIEVSRNVELWVEAFDSLGNGPATVGSRAEPLRVMVRAGAPQTQTTVPTDSVTGARPPPVARRADDPALLPPPPEPPPPPMMLSRAGRVVTAQRLVPGTVELRLDGAYQMGSDFLSPGAAVIGGAGELRASWVPLQFLELALGVQGRGAVMKRGLGDDLTAGSVGDVTVGARTVLPLTDELRLGLDASLEVAAPDWNRAVFAPSTQVGAALTWDLSWLRLHAHLAWRWDETERTLPGQWTAFETYAMGLSRYDALRTGVALEVPLPWVVPFAEYTLDVPVNRRALASCEGPAETCPAAPALLPAGALSMPQRLGLGARVELRERVGIEAGVELSLTRTGTDLSKVTPTPAGLVPVDGLASPPPFAARVRLVWQFDWLPGFLKPSEAGPKVEPAAPAVETVSVSPALPAAPVRPAPEPAKPPAIESSPTEPPPSKSIPTDPIAFEEASEPASSADLPENPADAAEPSASIDPETEIQP